MKIKRSSRFLNPVLSSHVNNRDYIIGDFYIEEPVYKQKSKDSDIEVTISNLINQDDILKEIEKGNAKAYLNIQCDDTYYRKCQEIKINEEIDLVLPYSYVVDDVTFQCFVSSEISNLSFSPSNLHDDYKGISAFNYSKGDILAISNQQKLIIPDDNLNSNFWKIVGGLDKDKHGVNAIFQPGGNIAVIQVTDEVNEQIQKIKGINNQNKDGIRRLFDSIYLAAHMEALKYVLDEDDDNYSGNLWYKGLRSKMDKLEEKYNPNDFYFDSPLVLAQAILEYEEGSPFDYLYEEEIIDE